MQRQNRHRWAFYTLSATALLGLLPTAAWACAVCWGASDALAHGLNVSIAFLMSMPFLISGTIISVLYLTHKRAHGQPASAIWNRGLARTEKENQS